jgi:GNAT superfamily N-acetyltransferase
MKFYFVTYVGDEPAGTLEFGLPTADNLHLADAALSVHPDHRRRGIGRQLFAAAVDTARAHGRTVLLGSYCAPLESGPYRDPAPAAFAAAVGAHPALGEVRRRLDLATVDTDEWQSRYEEALERAKGYTLLWWPGDAPDDDLAAGIAYLEGRMVTDSPIGDLRIEPERWDAQRVRDAEESLRQRRQPHFHAVVRDDATGRVVGWSALYMEEDEPSHAWQGTTIIDPDHRGHRLGLLIKLENLYRTRAVAAELRYVDTWNAAENTHMIAINEELGFRAVDQWMNWQYDLPEAVS